MDAHRDEGAAASFATTRWSLLARAASDRTTARRTALGEVVAAYAPALRAYLVRGRRMDEQDAEELLQEFFTSKVLEEGLVGKADPNKGRFRDLLVTALSRLHVDRLRRITEMTGLIIQSRFHAKALRVQSRMLGDGFFSQAFDDLAYELESATPELDRVAPDERGRVDVTERELTEEIHRFLDWMGNRIYHLMTEFPPPRNGGNELLAACLFVELVAPLELKATLTSSAYRRMAVKLIERLLDPKRPPDPEGRSRQELRRYVKVLRTWLRRWDSVVAEFGTDAHRDKKPYKPADPRGSGAHFLGGTARRPGATAEELRRTPTAGRDV